MDINLFVKIKTSLMIRTMTMLIFFSAAIILILYLFQFVFLNVYYEKYKTREVVNISKKLDKNINSIDTYLEKISSSKEICIERVTESGIILYNEHQKGCLLEKPNGKTLSLMQSMLTSSNEVSLFKLINPVYNTKSLLYGISLSDGSYVFMNSELESLDQTFTLISGQLIYILFLLVLISIIISFIISNTITKPIRDITLKAKKLAKGDFKVEFTSSSIRELNELSATLNYAKMELSKTDDYRRDLMANVGHDLKTPLTLIKSYAEMVKDISFKDEEKRNLHLNVIINETERLNELVKDIISLSKLENIDDSLNIGSYDLNKQIKEIVSKFEILELTENYHFIITSPENVIVNADEKKIAQVLYNLLGNAINYTGEDMTVYIDIIESKNNYRIEIKDTGKGIKKEEINLIWDRYYKTEKKHKRNKVGTGLGLSIVKNILEKHSFEYGVESKINKGTTFYFIIDK